MRILAVVLLLFLPALGACERESRRFSETPPTADPSQTVRLSPLEPGPTTRQDTLKSAYEDNAYATSQGKRLFTQFNCVGCHANGGGGMGPPLMDGAWLYGGEAENVFSSIAQGRPNGMPAFGGKVSSQQIWQLTAYVRALSGQLPKDVAPGRDDHMQRKSQEQQTDPAIRRDTRAKPAGQV
jgi:cytochrome c oxidase cbb3-type subunit III